MKFNTLIFFHGAGLTAVLSGCAMVNYTPTTIPTPRLEEKGDFSGSASFSMYFDAQDLVSLEAQAAYAFTDHWAVLGGVSGLGAEYGTILRNERHHFSERVLRGNELFFGGGYFSPFGSKGGVWDLYVGASIFEGENRFENQESSSFLARGAFIQSGIGWEWEDILVVNMGIRLDYNHYYRVHYQDDPWTSSGNYKGLLEQPTEGLFLQPHLSFQFGWSNFKFSGQVRSNHSLIRTQLKYPLFGITYGIVVNFKPRFLQSEANALDSNRP